MSNQEPTLAVLSPEMLKLARENSELLKQFLKGHGSASLKLNGVEGKEIALPDEVLKLVSAALTGVATGKRLKLLEIDQEVALEITLAEVSEPQRKTNGKVALQRMVEVSEEMGLYDE